MKNKICLLCLFILTFSQLQAKSTHSSPSFSEIAKKTIPAVVTVAVETKFFDLAYGSDPNSYWEYFRPLYEMLWPTEYYHGSGFFISSDGYIVTNAHVIEEATSLIVAVHGRRPRLYEATLVGVDSFSDVAVLKIDSDESFPYLEWGDSERLAPCDPIMVVGSPLATELESTVTMGVISGKERSYISELLIEGYLQTDAAITSGNSGGPVLSQEGKVIGIVDFGGRGMNFLIPSHLAKAIVEKLITDGQAIYGGLGVALEKDLEKAFNLYTFPSNTGARISEVFSNTSAEKSGLREGDLIREINGYPILSSASFWDHIFVSKPHSEIDLLVERDGELILLSVVLDEL